MRDKDLRKWKIKWSRRNELEKIICNTYSSLQIKSQG